MDSDAPNRKKFRISHNNRAGDRVYSWRTVRRWLAGDRRATWQAWRVLTGEIERCGLRNRTIAKESER